MHRWIYFFLPPLVCSIHLDDAMAAIVHQRRQKPISVWGWLGGHDGQRPVGEFGQDTPQITFTLSFFSKAVVILEVCLGSLSCWNTALRPSLRREGIMLCFCMSQYMLAFMVPSMNCSSPVPAALMQPQTMTLSQPCLTVGKTDLSLYSSPGCHHTRLTPSEPNKFILVSSDHRTWFQ